MTDDEISEALDQLLSYRRASAATMAVGAIAAPPAIPQ